MKSQLSRLPLASIILVEFLILLYLALSIKIPFGHDGFIYFLLQYYFLNNSIQSGEIAQWMPFMTHGTVANWWYYFQGNPLQSLWMLLTPKDTSSEALDEAKPVRTPSRRIPLNESGR